MNTTLRRITGVLLVVAAAAGLVFCVLSLASVWRYKQPVTAAFTRQLNQLNDLVGLTSQALGGADTSLSSSVDSLISMQQTLTVTAKSIQDTEPMLGTLSTMMGKDLPGAVTSAQTSLTAAQESARLIDNVLRTLSYIRIVQYNPPVPLQDALKQVSNSMNGLPASFSSMQRNLDTSRSNLQTVQANLSLMSANLGEIVSSLTSVQATISQYRTLLDEQQSRLEKARSRLPGWMNAIAIILSFVFIWIGITQVSVLLHGLVLLGFVSSDYNPRAPG